MGWLKKLFSGSITEGVITGAGLGGLIGTILDHRRGQQEIIRLLRLKEIRAQEAALDARVQATSRWVEEQRKKLPRPYDWWWKPPEDCKDLHDAVITRQSRDRVFNAEASELYDRWRGLCRRAMAARIMPLLAMPRSRSGDVAAPARTLRFAMDKLEARIDRRPIDPESRPQDEAKAATPGEIGIQEATALTGMNPVALAMMGKAGDVWHHEDRNGFWTFKRNDLLAARERMHILEGFEYMPSDIKALEKTAILHVDVPAELWAKAAIEWLG